MAAVELARARIDALKGASSARASAIFLSLAFSSRDRYSLGLLTLARPLNLSEKGVPWSMGEAPSSLSSGEGGMFSMSSLACSRRFPMERV